MSESKQIAQTILEQIKAAGLQIMWSWGAKNFVALGEKQLPCGGLQLGGLEFRVNGRIFKGIVQVRLMANDTYTVVLLKPYKGVYNVKGEFKDVYCDNLTYVIDSAVETKEAA